WDDPVEHPGDFDLRVLEAKRGQLGQSNNSRTQKKVNQPSKSLNSITNKHKATAKMPKAEKGTPKAIANAVKSKGLQRLQWYCQVCEKQCRDENGFKCHTMSEGHVRQMLVVGENAGKYINEYKCHTMSEGHVRQMLVVGENAGKYINEYSENFKKDFLALLSRRWGTKRVLANMVYQEYIADKNHSHMNATQWVTLSEFVKQMGREGILHVDETEKGLHMAWIDSSSQALARQAAHQAKERSELDDEEQMRKLIGEQIEKAQQEQAGGTGPSQSSTLVVPDQDRVLKRDQADGPLKLSFGTSIPQTNPLKQASTNPLKSKSSTSATTIMPARRFSGSTTTDSASRVAFLGPIGTYSHQVTRKQFSGSEYTLIPCDTIHGAVHALLPTTKQEHKRASWAVIPIENSYFGPVLESAQVLSEPLVKQHTQSIGLPIKFKIQHSLLAHHLNPTPTHRRFSRIYSHPQDNVQNIKTKYPGIEEIPTSSTSEAASIVSQDTSLSSLAICSASCVDYFMDLDVLDFYSRCWNRVWFLREIKIEGRMNNDNCKTYNSKFRFCFKLCINCLRKGSGGQDSSTTSVKTRTTMSSSTSPAVILVTGGNGLVGSALKRVIETKPIGSRFGKRTETEQWIFLQGSKDGDLQDLNQTLKIFETYKPTHILHVAALVGGLFANIKHNSTFLHNNLRINDNVLWASKVHKCKKVISCLSTCVFPDKVNYPINESMVHNGPPHQSNFGYAHAKRMVDIQNHAYHSEFGCYFTSAIPTNIFDNSHVIPRLSGEDGKERRSEWLNKF
ncbi:hypothetical protein PSTT_15893, partial [Puccinia striiformis]